MDGVRAANRFFAGFRQTEETHFTFAYEIGHCADDVLDRHGAIDAMLIQQIDMAGGEPPQRIFNYFANVCRPAIDTSDAAVLDLETKLGCDNCLVATAIQSAAQ